METTVGIFSAISKLLPNSIKGRIPLNPNYAIADKLNHMADWAGEGFGLNERVLSYIDIAASLLRGEMSPVQLVSIRPESQIGSAGQILQVVAVITPFNSFSIGIDGDVLGSTQSIDALVHAGKEIRMDQDKRVDGSLELFRASFMSLLEQGLVREINDRTGIVSFKEGKGSKLILIQNRNHPAIDTEKVLMYAPGNS